MSNSINQKFTFGRRARAAAIGAGACLLLSAMPGRAAYFITSDAATRNGTAIAVDGHCNLTEALTSLDNHRPVNSDCHDDGSGSRIDLDAPASPVPVYQLVSGYVILTSTPIEISTPSENPAIIEAPGFSVLTVSASSTVNMSYIILQHKAGSTGRVLTNMGNFSASFSTFQNGDASSTFEKSGGGIYNTGTITNLGFCIIQNNKALTGSGGGIYNQGIIDAAGSGQGIYGTKIWNNVAAQGGGIYSVRNEFLPIHEGRLEIRQSAIVENKAVATELTSGGTVTTLGGTACSSSEGSGNAFDDNFNNKWCNTGTASPSPGSPVTITYQFGSAKQVESYSITSANDAPERDPTNWTFEGANAATGPWTPLDTRTRELFLIPNAQTPDKLNRYLTRVYYFKNPNSYTFYHLKITLNNGSNTANPIYPGTGKPTKITQLAEVQMFQNWRTGDGGGIWYSTNMHIRNTTVSRNIAGCTSSSCACPANDPWCASASNTGSSLGRGGGVLASYWSPENGVENVPVTIASFNTVAGNSASQGGGFYNTYWSQGTWNYCIFGKNKARTNVSAQPDFHGEPHTPEQYLRGGSLFTNGNGPVTTVDEEDGTVGGFIAYSKNGIPDSDVVVADPGLANLSNYGSGSTTGYHLLSSSSRARDFVPLNSEGTTQPVDIRNDSRPVGSKFDLGSIERQSFDP